MRFSLDTNVLVYALDVEAGERHAIARTLVDRANLVDSVLTLQALGELFHVLARKLRQPADIARSDVARLQRAFPVVAADEACLSQAMDAVAKHSLSFWDAMLWATVREAGCEVLLSEDLQNGRTLGGVGVLNPFDPANEEQLADLLTG